MAELSGFVPPRGGTDIMVQGLSKRINFDDYNVNLIVSRCLEDQVDFDKANVLWQHLNYNEPLTQGMMNKFFVRSIDAFVYVSHWQYEKFRYVYSVPTENVYIIKNAIEPIEYIHRPKGEKIRIIYTSAPFRGLNILLDAFEMLDRDDVELDVYSSTLIYGSDYDNAFKSQYKELFDRASNMPNVNYHGYAENDEVIRALQRAHIYAYPSVFEETSCLAMIEAGAAGCALLSHNLGAIYETSAEYGRLLPVRTNNRQMAICFSKAINDLIEDLRYLTPYLQQQSEYFNTHYSWERIIPQWTRLASDISSI